MQDALDQLAERARALGCTVRFAPPAVSVPETILGSPLDPGLGDLMRCHDAVEIRGHAFALFVYGLAGSETIEWSTRGLRSLALDGHEYPFDGLVAFAQYGYQASYLCCVPALAGSDGSQPVLYIDTHEVPYAIPLASSVERLVLLLARYLELRATGLDRIFPGEVPELARVDGRLVELAKAGAFEPWLRGDRDWMRALVT